MPESLSDEEIFKLLLAPDSGLSIDPDNFDPCANQGFEIDYYWLKKHIGKTIQPFITSTYQHVVSGNKGRLVIMIGPNGTLPGQAGTSLSMCQPTWNNTLFLGFAGNGAVGSDGDLALPTANVVPTPAGGLGGNGGAIDVQLGDCCSVLAFSGKGGNGGIGKSAIIPSRDGGDGGDGGIGGDIKINLGNKCKVYLDAGNGGSGGVGGDVSTRGGVAQGGNGGDAARGGDITVQAPTDVLSTFFISVSGGGGIGGSGGSSYSPPGGPKIFGGEGGKGGRGGDIGLAVPIDPLIFAPAYGGVGGSYGSPPPPLPVVRLAKFMHALAKLFGFPPDKNGRRGKIFRI